MGEVGSCIGPGIGPSTGPSIVGKAKVVGPFFGPSVVGENPRTILTNEEESTIVGPSIVGPSDSKGFVEEDIFLGLHVRVKVQRIK